MGFWQIFVIAWQALFVGVRITRDCIKATDGTEVAGVIIGNTIVVAGVQLVLWLGGWYATH